MFWSPLIYKKITDTFAAKWFTILYSSGSLLFGTGLLVCIEKLFSEKKILQVDEREPKPTNEMKGAKMLWGAEGAPDSGLLFNMGLSSLKIHMNITIIIFIS